MRNLFALYNSGNLQTKIDSLYAILEKCELCPRKCNVNRLAGEIGYCQAELEPVVSSVFPHFGEEAPLVGHHGSGTIFFSHCNLRCVFCQNYDISHLGNGEKVDRNQLAKLMMFLQQSGCHNINFVTPTHYVPQIISALPVAIEMGLEIPLVYNCGGYESVEVITLLNGIIDIYMPDTKFVDEKYAIKYLNAPSYFTNLKSVLKEMQRQVGDLQLDEDGIAYQGLIIRHLVMPELIAGSAEIFRFIAQEISRNAYVNIMNQYHPCYEAFHDRTLNQLITTKEFHTTIKMAQEVGLHRGF